MVQIFIVILIILTVIITLVLLSLISWRLYQLENNTEDSIDKIYNKIERNILRKFKGISKEDQINLDYVHEKIKEDVDNSLKHMKFEEKPFSLPQWPSFTKAINKDPSLLGSLLSSDGILSMILPALKGGDNGILGLLNMNTAKTALGAGLALKVLEKAAKSVGVIDNDKDEDKPKHPRSTREKDFVDSKPVKVIRKFQGMM